MNPMNKKNQMKDTLAHLQTRGDLFTRQLLAEKQRVSHLKNQLLTVNEDITSVRDDNKKKAVSLLNMHTTTAKDAYRRADGLNPTRLADINQKKLVTNLESRLNKALVRHNEVQNENNVIKSKVDKLRRKIYNDDVNRSGMEKKLETIREEMDKIMEKAAISSELRDKAVEKRNQLINDNYEEQQAFRAEYRELGEFITEQTERLEASIASVTNDVISNSRTIGADDNGATNAETTTTTTTKTAAHPLSSNGTPYLSHPEDDITTLSENISQLEKQITMNEQLLSQTEDKIRTYEENFEQLRTVSGLTSHDDIITDFCKNEDESFSLFNYIQAVNQETDVTLEQHVALEKEIEMYTNDQMEQESQRVSIVNDYRGRLDDAREERLKMTEVAKEGKTTIERIAEKVQTLYRTLRCEDLEVGDAASNNADTTTEATSSLPSSPTKTLLSSPGGVSAGEISVVLAGGGEGEMSSERNILRSMELIEKRSMQIIAEYARKLALNKKNRRKLSVLLSPKMFRRLSNTSHQEHLGFSDDDESDNDDNGGRPLSLHEMRRQTAERLKRSQAQGLDIRKQLRKATC